jgi:DNA uptake protein ComE-like DNA-binding protein
VDTDSLHQLKTLTGLSEDQAEKISQGCPCQHNDELVTRQILSQKAYDKIKDLIIVE